MSHHPSELPLGAYELHFDPPPLAPLQQILRFSVDSGDTTYIAINAPHIFMLRPGSTALERFSQNSHLTGTPLGNVSDVLIDFMEVPMLDRALHRHSPRLDAPEALPDVEEVMWYIDASASVIRLLTLRTGEMALIAGIQAISSHRDGPTALSAPPSGETSNESNFATFTAPRYMARLNRPALVILEVQGRDSIRLRLMNFDTGLVSTIRDELWVDEPFPPFLHPYALAEDFRTSSSYVQLERSRNDSFVMSVDRGNDVKEELRALVAASRHTPTTHRMKGGNTMLLRINQGAREGFNLPKGTGPVAWITSTNVLLLSNPSGNALVAVNPVAFHITGPHYQDTNRLTSSSSLTHRSSSSPSSPSPSSTSSSSMSSSITISGPPLPNTVQRIAALPPTPAPSTVAFLGLIDLSCLIDNDAFPLDLVVVHSASNTTWKLPSYVFDMLYPELDTGRFKTAVTLSKLPSDHIHCFIEYLFLGRDLGGLSAEFFAQLRKEIGLEVPASSFNGQEVPIPTRGLIMQKVEWSTIPKADRSSAKGRYHETTQISPLLLQPTDFAFSLQLPHDQSIAIIGNAVYMYVRWAWFRKLWDDETPERCARHAVMPPWVTPRILLAILECIHSDKTVKLKPSDAKALWEGRHEWKLVDRYDEPMEPFLTLIDHCYVTLWPDLTPENCIELLKRYNRLGNQTQVEIILEFIIGSGVSFDLVKVLRVLPERLVLRLMAKLRQRRFPGA